MAAIILLPSCSRIYVAIGAACWASYLINGDASGLSDDERALADAWCDRELGPNDAIVDCGEAYFTWSYGLYTGAPFRGGDVVDYRVIEAKPDRWITIARHSAKYTNCGMSTRASAAIINQIEGCAGGCQ